MPLGFVSCEQMQAWKILAALTIRDIFIEQGAKT
jgi:hypothetical protein